MRAGLEGVAKQEAESMFMQTDANKDGKLTFDEVLAKTNQWVGCKASAPHHHTLRHETVVVQPEAAQAAQATPPEAQAQPTPPEAQAQAAPSGEQAKPKPEL